MASKHSYELEGKKLSFANWISNLSPTETPFCSMTPKEATNQIKFHWQEDRLVPVNANNFHQEGSDAVDEAMSVTAVRSNVVQILRRCFSVSDTA
ncbi:MAG: SU10 major capsid protein, partial [Cetobacterium sp.]|uniref:SU10 major capsid protein n=1 Tax=Cetobacterium sp. TaxID=2071632 RepID=UPI003EE7DB59